jgi:hypothetical protein
MDRPIFYILVQLIVSLSEKWKSECLELYINTQQKKLQKAKILAPPISTSVKKSSMNSEVLGMVGYGVAKLIMKRKNACKEAEEIMDGSYTENEFVCHKIYKFAKGMRIFHEDAIRDDEYVKKYYCHEMMIRNKGRLTLVSKKYFPFGLLLMQNIRKVVNEKTLGDLKNDSFHNGYETICNDASLKESFFSVHNVDIDENVKNEILEYIVTKAFRAKYRQVQKLFIEKNTGRYAKKGTVASHRGELKISSAKKDKEKMNNKK